MDEESSESILLSIKPWLESGGPFTQAGGVASATEEEAASEDASFSALDLRDRVVVTLLQERVVRVAQVEAAWNRWQNEDTDTPDALWRVVARLPGVEAEAVFAAAARVYAFAPATSILYRAQAFLREHRSRFSLRQRRRLVALGVLPLTIEETPAGPCWVFATHDPARPAVHALLADVQVPAHELRYAPASAVRERLEEAFPGEVALETRASDKAAAESPGRERGTPAGTPSAGGERLLSFLDTLFSEGEAERRQRPRGSETARTFASIYEELIAGAARSGAARVRLAAGEGGHLAALFDYDERGEQRSVELDVPPEAVLSFMRRRTRSARRGTTVAEGKNVHRWVAGRRHSFRIAPLPASAEWSAGRGEIVIEAVE